jgi:hypothetical protein
MTSTPITIRPIQCPYGPLQQTSWVYPVAPPVLLPPPPLETKQPTPERWYINDNIHTYTHYWRNQLPTLLPLIAQYGTSVEPQDWANLKLDISAKYQHHPLISATLANINQHYQPLQGSIWNPELPGLNSAVLLTSLWAQLKRLNEPSLFAHFYETLLAIGTTCLAGITDRLLADFVAVHDGKIEPQR